MKSQFSYKKYFDALAASFFMLHLKIYNFFFHFRIVKILRTKAFLLYVEQKKPTKRKEQYCVGPINLKSLKIKKVKNIHIRLKMKYTYIRNG